MKLAKFTAIFIICFSSILLVSSIALAAMYYKGHTDSNGLPTITGYDYITNCHWYFVRPNSFGQIKIEVPYYLSPINFPDFYQGGDALLECTPIKKGNMSGPGIPVYNTQSESDEANNENKI
jgi:hypothetical protein